MDRFSYISSVPSEGKQDSEDVRSGLFASNRWATHYGGHVVKNEYKWFFQHNEHETAVVKTLMKYFLRDWSTGLLMLYRSKQLKNVIVLKTAT